MIQKLIVLVLFSSVFVGEMHAQSVSELLIARNTGSKILANSDTIRVFGFAQDLLDNPNVPGPTIYANEGDSVHLDLWNVSQGAPHTIHLHGLDVDQQNDGVPHLSFEVGHMDHGFYHFKAPHAGTYLYHCHVVSSIHVQAGMYGLIIIKPSDGGSSTWNGGYAFDNDFSFLMSEIDTNWHTDSVLMHAHDTTMPMMPIAIPDFHPQFFLINGFSDQQLAAEGIEFTAAVDEVNYVRLTNIGYCGTRVIFPAGLNAKIIDSDGRALPTEEISDTIYIFPGERYGVLSSAEVEFTDFIQFEYFNLNTLEVKNTQLVPVIIAGFAEIVSEEMNGIELSIVPNPFNDLAEIRFHLPKGQELSISIFDVSGRSITEIESMFYEAGNHVLPISQLVRGDGHYLVRLSSEGKSLTQKFVRY